MFKYSLLQYRYGLSRVFSKTREGTYVSDFLINLGLVIVAVTSLNYEIPFRQWFWQLSIVVSLMVFWTLVVKACYFIKKDEVQNLKTIEEFLTSDNEHHRNFARRIVQRRAKPYAIK
jgi:uncharacterized membrane protein